MNLTNRLKLLLSQLRPDWRTFVSGLLLVFAFPPWDITPFIWVALVPWFLALDDSRSRKAAFLQGIWLSVFMTIGGFYWVSYSIREFGGVPWPLSIFGLCLFSLFNEIQFLVFAPFYRSWRERLSQANLSGAYLLGIILGLSLFYTGLDWILPKLFVDTLGHAFYASPRLRQLADLGGATAITFLVVTANFVAYQLWLVIRHYWRSRSLEGARKTVPLVAFFVLFLLAALQYGSHRVGVVQEAIKHSSRRVQLGVVQANIGDFDKIAAENGIRGAGTKVIQTYLDLSDRVLALSPRPEALIWPETAYPSTFRTPQNADELARDQQLERFVRERGVPLLFGGYDQAGGKDFNTFFFLSPSGEGHPAWAGAEGDLQIYHKAMLLMFGEYIPGADSISLFKQLFPQVGNFGRGIGPQVLSIPPTSANPGRERVRVGPIICYEALFPNFVIEAARKGSQMILNITNDSWFGPYGEPHLHLALTIFRSIETRLAQLRATNTGVSALILPDGQISERSPIFEPHVMNVSVPLLAEPIPTLMVAWGDWFGPFTLVVGLLSLAGIWAFPLWKRRIARVPDVAQNPENTSETP